MPPATLWSTRKPPSWSHASAWVTPCRVSSSGLGQQLAPGAHLSPQQLAGAASEPRPVCVVPTRPVVPGAAFEGERCALVKRPATLRGASNRRRNNLRGASDGAAAPPQAAARLGLHVDQYGAGSVDAISLPKICLRRAVRRGGHTCEVRERACRVAAPKSWPASPASAASALNSAVPSWLPH